MNFKKLSEKETVSDSVALWHLSKAKKE